MKMAIVSFQMEKNLVGFFIRLSFPNILDFFPRIFYSLFAVGILRDFLQI